MNDMSKVFTMASQIGKKEPAQTGRMDYGCWKDHGEPLRAG